MKKKILSIILTFVLCMGLLSSTVLTVNAASSFNTSSSSTIYYYTIKNVKSGKYLNVYNNSSSNNANITLWSKDNSSGENYGIYASGSGTYVLVPECATSRAVNIYGTAASSGSNVCTWSKSGHSTQLWQFVAVSGGYVIKSANNTNYVLTASGTSNGSNVCIQKYKSGDTSQIWTLSLQKTVKSGSSSSSSSTVTNIKSKMKTTYSSALSRAGRSSFNGYCGLCVATQLQVLGVTSGYTGFNGNNAYETYKNSTKTSGGYKVTSYSITNSGMNSLLTSLNNKVSCTSNQYLMLCFQKGDGSTAGQTYGHVLLIYAINNGIVYYTESFVPSGQSNAYNCSKSISDFCKAYGTSPYVCEGAILFSK